MKLFVTLGDHQVEPTEDAQLLQRTTSRQPSVVYDMDKAWTGFRRVVGDDPDATFSIVDVAGFAGITKATAHKWLRRGILRASVQPAVGSGTPVVFDWVDAFIAGVIGSLSRHGVPLTALQAIGTELFHARQKRARIRRTMERAQHVNQN